MSHYEHANPNPRRKNVGDCTVRAISLATDQDWVDVYFDLCLQGFIMSDMPSSNEVWGKYLADNGWQFHRLPDSCPFCYTINDFCNDHDNGTFIVATGSHVVCVQDGKILDTWDPGDRVPLFYFERE